MTTCKDAIKAFEADTRRNKEGKPAVGKRLRSTPEMIGCAECECVKLYFQSPPMAKLDGAALATLKNCSHLACSTNNIEKMVNLTGMESLKILSLGRNKVSPSYF